MLILGLGSNIGDRLGFLRLALKALKQTAGISIKKISPLYVSDALLPDHAPDDWNQPYINLAIRCETTLEPLDLLKTIKAIEWSIGRKPNKRHWGPRELDIDILAINDSILESDELNLPHNSILDRPFVLWPMADVAPFWQYPKTGKHQGLTAAQLCEKWGSRFSGEAPFHTHQIQQRIDCPALVGIINITPDSFSDGGKFLGIDTAMQQAEQLIRAGATVLDLGAESTAPNSQKLDAQTEWQRLEPVLKAISQSQSKFLLPAKISIDTRHASTAEKALHYPIHWINDVTGLSDPAMVQVVKESDCDLVVMHHLGIPPSKLKVLPRDQNPVNLLISWAKEHFIDLEREGIDPSRIIFDPGIGFGKAPEQSMMLVKHAEFFSQLGSRILIGHSRKSFLSLLTDRHFADRDIETLSLSIELANKPIDYLRVHNIDATSRGLKTIKS